MHRHMTIQTVFFLLFQLLSIFKRVSCIPAHSEPSARLDLVSLGQGEDAPLKLLFDDFLQFDPRLQGQSAKIAAPAYQKLLIQITGMKVHFVVHPETGYVSIKGAKGVSQEEVKNALQPLLDILEEKPTIGAQNVVAKFERAAAENWEKVQERMIERTRFYDDQGAFQRTLSSKNEHPSPHPEGGLGKVAAEARGFVREAAEHLRP